MVNWDQIMSEQQQTNHAGGRRPNVRFFVAYNLNSVKSANEGKPVYDEITSVSIKFAGMDETVRRVEEMDKANYPREWEAFSKGIEAIAEGTPLSEWAMIPASAAKELNHFGFFTIEQLAEAPDAAKAKIGTLAQFCVKAQKWVEAASSDQNRIVALEAAIENERNRNRRLEEKLEVLIARINATEGTNMTYEKEVEEAPSNVDMIEEEIARATKPRRKRGA
jgi:hypothetical protein